MRSASVLALVLVTGCGAAPASAPARAERSTTRAAEADPELDAAVRVFEQAAELNPSPPALYNVAMAYLAAARWDDARRVVSLLRESSDERLRERVASLAARIEAGARGDREHRGLRYDIIEHASRWLESQRCGGDRSEGPGP